MSTPIGASSSSVSRRGSGRQRIQRYTTETNEEDTEFLGFFVKYSDLRGNIIKFPSTFTDRRGHLIDQYVVLDTSDRRRHYIGVERRNGNIWLSDDWNALSADCDIKLLDTIYFKHNYADFFDVVMFSPTGLEYRHGRTTPTELPAAFFKQIVTVDYFMKIAIPDEFTNAFRGILQNTVALIGPDDVEWMLECVMIDGSLWFTEGWTEVVVNYNIKKKDFIYFQVASWGAYLLSRDILAVSFAPRDTHEAQVQFALERGVPALIGVLASIRLPYPSRAFDMAHCSRCLIPWGQNDGIYLAEVDRVLRPGGYWILSGPPINWETHWKGWERTRESLKDEQDGIERVTKSLCWKKLVQKGDIAIWQKPTNHIHCKITRKVFKNRPFCSAKNPDSAWYTKMDTCLTPVPEVNAIKDISGGELANWPKRLTTVPPRISSGSLEGITGEIFYENTALWMKRVAYYKTLDYQLAEPGRYRNLLDMNAYLGGFAAALIDDPVWVMNAVPVEAEINTLGVIYERGLIGTYQNWCEAMSTYPRTYDFIHGDSVFSLYQNRCDIEDILLEMDRILRPQGSVILRDDVDVLLKVKKFADAMQWDTRIADHEKGPHQREKILTAVKQYWTAPSPSENQHRKL